MRYKRYAIDITPKNQEIINNDLLSEYINEIHEGCILENKDGIFRETINCSKIREKDDIKYLVTISLGSFGVCTYNYKSFSSKISEQFNSLCKHKALYNDITDTEKLCKFREYEIIESKVVLNRSTGCVRENGVEKAPKIKQKPGRKPGQKNKININYIDEKEKKQEENLFGGNIIYVPVKEEKAKLIPVKEEKVIPVKEEKVKIMTEDEEDTEICHKLLRTEINESNLPEKNNYIKSSFTVNAGKFYYKYMEDSFERFQKDKTKKKWEELLKVTKCYYECIPPEKEEILGITRKFYNTIYTRYVNNIV